MQVYDARPSVGDWKIDTHGFRIAQFKTSLTFTMENLFDDKEVDVRNVYVPEVEEMMKRNPYAVPAYYSSETEERGVEWGLTRIQQQLEERTLYCKIGATKGLCRSWPGTLSHHDFV